MDLNSILCGEEPELKLLESIFCLKMLTNKLVMQRTNRNFSLRLLRHPRAVENPEHAISLLVSFIFLMQIQQIFLTRSNPPEIELLKQFCTFSLNMPLALARRYYSIRKKQSLISSTVFSLHFTLE